MRSREKFTVKIIRHRREERWNCPRFNRRDVEGKGEEEGEGEGEKRGSSVQINERTFLVTWKSNILQWLQYPLRCGSIESGLGLTTRWPIPLPPQITYSTGWGSPGNHRERSMLIIPSASRFERNVFPALLNYSIVPGGFSSVFLPLMRFRIHFQRGQSFRQLSTRSRTPAVIVGIKDNRMNRIFHAHSTILQLSPLDVQHIL